jgi:hypothetical protein
LGFIGVSFPNLNRLPGCVRSAQSRERQLSGSSIRRLVRKVRSAGRGDFVVALDSGRPGPGEGDLTLVSTLGYARVKRILAIAGALLVLWAVAGFVVLPRVLRPVIEKKLAGRLHRPVTLDGLSINPFALSATLEGLAVRDKDGGPFFSFERLYLNIESSSIIRGGPVLSAIRLSKPRVTLVRFADGTYNIRDLVGEGSGSKAEEPLRFSLNNIEVDGGSLDFDDRSKQTRHAVRDVRIGVPFLSNIPSKVKITTQPVLEAKVNGAPFALHGRTKPFSETRETTLDLVFDDVDLPFYLAYAPREIPVRIASARLDAKLTITFRQPPEGPPALVVSGGSALRKVAVSYDGRPLVAWNRLEVVLDSVDVFGRKTLIRSLKAVGPELWIRRETMKEHNIANAFAAPAARKPREGAPEAAKAPEEAGRPFLVAIAEAGIEAGKVHYDNLAFQPAFHALFGDLAVSLKGFSTAPGKEAKFEASARTDAGEVFRSSGTVAMGPFVLDGTFSVDGVPLPRYATFVDEFVPVVLDAGTLDLRTAYRFSTGDDADTVLTGLTVTLRSPRLRKKGDTEPFFAAASAGLSETSIDLAKHQIVVGSLRSAAGTLAVVREEDGRADLMSLVPKPPADAPPPPPAPWDVTLKRLALSGYTVKIDDRRLDRPESYSLTKADLRLEGFSTARGAKARLFVRTGLDGRGIATAKGPIGFQPIFADLKLEAKGIDLVPIQAYALQNLKLDLARGTASAAGTLSLREDAGGKASVVYTGDALVSHLLAVDPSTTLDVLRWETMSATGMKAGFNPIFFEARQVAASGVACDIVIEPDGVVNLRKVVGQTGSREGEDVETESSVESGARASPSPAPTPAPPPPPAAAAPPSASGSKEAGGVIPVRIDELTLEGGRIALADHFVKPNYSATLGSLGGRLTGLSSADGTVAGLDLRGELANHSPLQVSGTINLLAAASFADVKASFRDIDLASFTSYSGKYAGYKIASGTLTVEVAYKLRNRRLEASNRFLVTGFDFGEKVESRSATKLPVRFAVSLLKDKDGVIDLDLPIEGSLDDPKFRIGRVVLKVLTNLIAKAATAPFALLGGLLGGKGEEYSTVSFADGVATLDDAARKKLDGLARALRERPALKLEVTGRFSGDADLEGLRRERVARKVKARKLADLAKEGAAPASVDDVVVSEAEYLEYLKKAYKKEAFPKPRTALGFAKDLPAPEMEKLMLANVAVGRGDLRALALARANRVKTYLIGPAAVDPSRVLVHEPPDKPAPPKDKAPASRVDVALK